MRRRERSNEIYMNMAESSEGNRDLLGVEVDVAENLPRWQGREGLTISLYDVLEVVAW